MTLPPSAETRTEVTTRALGRRSWERTQSTSCPYRPYDVFRTSYTARRVHVNSCVVAPKSRFMGPTGALGINICIYIYYMPIWILCVPQAYVMDLFERYGSGEAAMP